VATFVFRIDGAAENSGFLEKAREDGHVVYAGLTLTLQRGWIPDFIEINTTQNPTSACVTLIELEGSTNVALTAARKYLPESSEQIMDSVRRYLQRVLQRCRSTADPRTAEVLELCLALSHSTQTSVWAAAALRRPPEVIERLPLMDQGQIPAATMVVTARETSSTLLNGVMSLSSRDHKTLSRSVLILDAIVRAWDKSDASLRAWRNLRSQPLRHQLRQRPEVCPTLSAILIGQKHGVRISVDEAAHELATLWNEIEPARYSATSVKAAISAFAEIDRTLDPSKSVRLAFEHARHVLQHVSAA